MFILMLMDPDNPAADELGDDALTAGLIAPMPDDPSRVYLVPGAAGVSAFRAMVTA